MELTIEPLRDPDRLRPFMVVGAARPWPPPPGVFALHKFYEWTVLFWPEGNLHLIPILMMSHVFQIANNIPWVMSMFFGGLRFQLDVRLRQHGQHVDRVREVNIYSTRRWRIIPENNTARSTWNLNHKKIFSAAVKMPKISWTLCRNSCKLIWCWLDGGSQRVYDCDPFERINVILRCTINQVLAIQKWFAKLRISSVFLNRCSVPPIILSSHSY